MYAGRLKSPKLIAPILEELRDLSEEHGWECESVGPKDFALVYGPVVTVSGIHLTLDPEAGMFAKLSMFFDQEGNLVNETMLTLYSDEKHLRRMNETINPFTGEPQHRIWIPKTKADKKKFAWADLVKSDLFTFNSIDTHNLGPEKHILLCKLLRYLRKKYFKRFRVDDSSDYWKTGDASELVEQIQIMNYFYGHVGKFFDHVAANPLPKNATLKDLLDDLTTYLALVSTQAPHQPARKPPRQRRASAKNKTSRRKKK
jgi:hypothetical protein